MFVWRIDVSLKNLIYIKRTYSVTLISIIIIINKYLDIIFVDHAAPNLWKRYKLFHLPVHPKIRGLYTKQRLIDNISYYMIYIPRVIDWSLLNSVLML